MERIMVYIVCTFVILTFSGCGGKKKDRIVYHFDRTMIGKQINPVFIKKISEDSGHFIDHINGDKTTVTYIKSKSTDWKMVALVPNKLIYAKTSAISNNMILLIVVCFLMLILFAFLISKKYLSPIKKITQSFQKLQENNIDLNTRLDVVSNDEIGELIIWFNAFLDSAKEKKNMEEKLYKSREQYKSVVDNVKEVIFQTDAEGRWIFLNPAWTEITEFSIEESIGVSSLLSIYPDDRERSMELFNLLMKRKEEFCRCRVRYMTKKEAAQWFEVFVRPTLDNHGSRTYLLV